MRVYTVHFRPSLLSRDHELVLIKEGFCWPAFLFTVIWAAWHRLWLVAGLTAAALIGLEILLLLAGADQVSRLACEIGLQAFIGFGANDWRRAKLTRSAYRQAGVVSAQNEDAAVRRFFDLNPEMLSADGAASPY